MAPRSSITTVHIQESLEMYEKDHLIQVTDLFYDSCEGLWLLDIFVLQEQF